MEGTYTVMFGPNTVGRVEVRQEGLYYHFSCCCERLESNMYYLVAEWTGGREKLGLMTPRGAELVLETKIPIKRFGEGKPWYKLLPKHEKARGEFVPVYPEEPFAYLRRLENAFLATRNGQTGIVLDVQKNVK